jgi:lipopolysaccharide/colanic/teichoic acid biosynthesis glycosyltransferase
MRAILDFSSPVRSVSRQRRRLNWLAVAVDLGLLLLLGALFWWALGFFQTEVAERLRLVRVWLIIGVFSGLLSRSHFQRTLLQRRQASVYLPVWAFFIAALTFMALGWTAVLPLLFSLHVVWLVLIAAVLWFLHRMDPPLRLGVLSGAPAAPGDAGAHLLHPRLRYVLISPHQPGTLSQVDGILLNTDVYLQPDQQRLIEHARVTKLPVWSKNLLDEELSGKVSLDLVHRDWLDETTFYSSYMLFKRGLDVALTLVLLPALLLLMGVVALVVLFNSGRPILFWQERVGKDGVPFRIVKFRTMTRDSEQSGPAFAQHGDLRVTPVGAFLRKFRLDELPQFWNVLTGDMSIIGPRPEQWAFAADFEESIPLYATRHWVRPGITGWAQVNQGYAADVGQTVEKLRYDFYYVKHLSLQLDLLIVFKTIQTILTGFGAR